VPLQKTNNDSTKKGIDEDHVQDLEKKLQAINSEIAELEKR
jgi:hypothetical protein